MIKIINPPAIREGEDVSKAIKHNTNEILAIIKMAREKYDYGLEPEDFAMAWFMRKIRVAELLTDDGKTVEGTVVWITGTKWYDSEITTTVLVILAPDDEKRKALIDYVIDISKMAGAVKLYYDTGIRNKKDDVITEQIYYELNLWQME